ncbi:hypothetical protein [Glycomyces sp. MUSA5-2]|uniref:hypothetical protein n=1 Tax=Glycomyces sp. MUSA5-2 TaxID=2053002 RepID=UPI00300B64B7
MPAPVDVATGPTDRAARPDPGRPAGFVLPRRPRIILAWTWLPRAAPYLARAFGPGIAAAALIALGTEVVLDPGTGLTSLRAIAAAAATLAGVGACVAGAVGRIRQYRAQIPPDPYL